MRDVNKYVVDHVFENKVICQDINGIDMILLKAQDQFTVHAKNK